VIVIAPPKAQLVVQVALTTGCPPASTSGTPGVHGSGCGVHGCGVSTPCAAAVADATAGFASEEHMPNGATFTMPALSGRAATGLPSTSTWLAGSTVSVAGAEPNEQASVAVEVVIGAGTQPTVRRGPRPRPVRQGRLRRPATAPTGNRRCPDGQARPSARPRVPGVPGVDR